MYRIGKSIGTESKLWLLWVREGMMGYRATASEYTGSKEREEEEEEEKEGEKKMMIMMMMMMIFY